MEKIMTATSIARRLTALLFAAAFVTVVIPGSAEAQSRFKRLKNAVRPDSAARADAALKDSIAKGEASVAAAAMALEGTTSAASPGKKSRLKRAVSATKKAADKVEDVTGISAKDAALMATGVGVGAIAAKKLGVDPSSISARAMEAAGNVAQQRASASQVQRGAPAMQGVPSVEGFDPAAMQAAMRAAQSRRASAATMPPMPVTGPATTGMPGFSEADAKAMMAFQQEMMQVSMAASQGDAKAQARLERWAAIAEKYEPEMLKLSTSMSNTGAADLKTIQRLHAIQIEMMREWSRTSGGRAKAAKP
jgi:hypothetical protein